MEATGAVMHNIPEQQICCLGQTLISFDNSCWVLPSAQVVLTVDFWSLTSVAQW